LMPNATAAGPDGCPIAAAAGSVTVGVIVEIIRSPVVADACVVIHAFEVRPKQVVLLENPELFRQFAPQFSRERSGLTPVRYRRGPGRSSRRGRGRSRNHCRAVPPWYALPWPRQFQVGERSAAANARRRGRAEGAAQAFAGKPGLFGGLANFLAIAIDHEADGGPDLLRNAPGRDRRGGCWFSGGFKGALGGRFFHHDRHHRRQAVPPQRTKRHVLSSA